MNHLKRAVGYVRVSTKAQIEGTSISEQKRRIKEYCGSQDFELLRFYTDEGVPGSVKQRPEFQQMLADAKAKVFDVLVVLAIDRLNRNLRHFLDTFELLKGWEVGLVSVAENINTASRSGDFTIKLFSLLAELERNTIRERTKSGRVASFKNGKAFPGVPPFGYLWDRKKKEIKIDKKRADIYFEIVDWYLHDGLSTTSIAERLTYDEIETPGSRRYKNKKSTNWTDDMIRRMLHNTAYYGEAIYLKKGYETVVSEDGNPYHKQVDKPNPLGPITIKFPPLISRKQFDDIQKRIEYNKRKPKKIRKKNAVDKFLTSNTLGTHFICDLCGTVIRSRTYYDKRAEKTRYQYGCSRQLTSNKQLKLRGKEKCHMPAINADGFDIEVWDSVITLLSNPLKYLKSWKPFEEQKSVNNTIKQLEKKMRKKQRELDRFTKRIVKVSDARIVESYQKEQHELSEKIRHISADIGVLQRKNKASTDSIKYIKKLVEEAEKAVWEMEQIVAGKEPGDVEDVIIPTIYDEFENLKSYQVKKEVLEAVVSPEQGGFVKMTYDRNEERHYVELDAKLNYLRIGRIIKALTNGTLADGSFFNPNYRKRTQ